MISKVESFPYPEKQETSEVGRRMQRPKRCVTINNNKDEDNSPKNNIHNNACQASSKKKFRQTIKRFLINFRKYLFEIVMKSFQVKLKF